MDPSIQDIDKKHVPHEAFVLLYIELMTSQEIIQVRYSIYLHKRRITLTRSHQLDTSPYKEKNSLSVTLVSLLD